MGFYPFWFSSDKKCTYGIKCKFYHPERANQSYLSLADELREKAQISTGKDRNARLSPKQLQSDSGSAHNACYHPQDSNTELIRNQNISSFPGQVCENKLLYWDDPRNTQNHRACSSTESLHSMPSHYYANISHECLDSGLGSFESQYSDTSHCLSNSHRLRPQRQNVLPGPSQFSVHLENNATSQSCTCCSHAVPSAAPQHPPRNLDAKGKASYPPHMYLPKVPHQHIIPSYFHYTHDHQQNYWSDPFQEVPQARTRTLPSSVHSSHSHSSYCSSKSQQYHTWGQPQPCSASFDPKRSELRKKLHAIFNPHQVDAVMEMFPHLMDAQKLAAEILNLKSRGGIF